MQAEKMERRSGLRWIRVNDIKVSSNAQRKFKPAKADEIAASFDPDKFGLPVVNIRDGHPWVIDGQHRVAALKIIGYGDTLIECDTYEGLSEKEEAERFDGLNDVLAVRPFDKFFTRLTAQRRRELGIARTVQSQGLVIGEGTGQIKAVTALGKIYDKAGPDRLGAALRILRDAYGDGAMTAKFIEGMGLVTHRYNGVLDEAVAVEKLARLQNGSFGLLQKAALLKRQTGRPSAQCVAAAVVEVVNSGRGGKKLPDWWAG